MKKSLLILFVLAIVTFSQEPLSVLAYDEQSNNESAVTLRVKVINNSPHTFENVELRYYFAPKQGKQVILENYYLSGATAAIVKVDSTQSYLQILIQELGPGEMPNLSGFSIGLHYSDWSPWQKSEDFSYPGVGSFSETQKFPLFIDQALVAGLTPSIVKESPVMLMQHGTETMFIEGEWAGTILAPNADLVLGQSNKTLYGRFAGKNVTVHQFSEIYIVPFNPTELYEVVLLGGVR